MKPHVDLHALPNALSPQQLLRATFTSDAKRSAGEPKALSNTPIVLKKRILGPNGPRIKVKAVQEIVCKYLTQ